MVDEPSQSGGAEAQAVADAVAAAAAAANERRLRKLGKNFLIGMTVVGGLAVLVAFGYCGHSVGCERWDVRTFSTARKSFILATIIWVVLILLFSLLRKNGGGLRTIFLGKDGRLSTGAVQSAMWTIALAFGLSMLALEESENSFKELDINYMILLGGPFAAAGIARVSTARKVEEGAIQKTDATSTSLGDVVSDDNGNTDLVDLQFLVFNFIVLIVYVVGLIGDSTELPNLETGLVGLTSLAAITYAGTKASINNAPVITSVSKVDGVGAVRPGDDVVLLGTNFIPPGAQATEFLLRVRVRFGGREMSVLTDPDDKNVLRNDRIVVTVPEDVPAEPTTPVTVVTAAGVESDSYPLQVVADVPVISGIADLPVEEGKPLLITGRFFQRPKVGGQATVMFGNVPILGRDTKDGRVKVDPPVPTGDTVSISVRARGGLVASDPVVVPAKR